MTINDSTSTDIVLSKKRPRTDSGRVTRRSKRQKKKLPDIQQIAKVFKECDYQKMGENKVWVTQSLFDRIYPKSNLSDHQYIRVAHYIYELGGITDMEDYQVGINEVQDIDLQDYLCPPTDLDSLQVRPYRDSEVRYRNIEHMVFKIQTWGQIQTQGRRKGSVKLAVDELREAIIKAFKHQFFEMGQRAFLNHNAGPMLVKVVERTYEKEDDPFEELRSGNELPRYGLITENTRIDFRSTSYNIDLVQEQDLSKVKKFHFQIASVNDVSRRVMSSTHSYSSVDDAWKKGCCPIPLSLEKPTFFQQVREKMSEKQISVGHTEEVRFNTDWVLKVKFTKVELTDDMNIDDDDRYYYEKNYEKTFKLEKDHAIAISPGSRCILTTADEYARRADRMKFAIVGWEVNRVLAPNEKITVSAEELEKYIRDHFGSNPVKGRMVVPMGADKFLIELESAIGEPSKQLTDGEITKDSWYINEGTEIRLRSNNKDYINIVDTNEPVEVEKVYVNVKKAPSGLGGFMMLFGGGGGDEDKKIVDEKELLELFHEKAPKTFLRKHTFSAVTSESDKVNFTCENFYYPGKGDKKVTHGLLYKITPETEIVIDSDKESALIIQTEPKKIDYDKIPEHLKELGVGGLPHGCYRFIRNILLSRGEYKDVFKRLKVRCERGVIIYGPPGTGKTLIARNIGKMLNITDDRISVCSGSDLLNKYVGETEKNIRALYQPARDAYEKFGDKAPTFLVIVDEGEEILGKRKGKEKEWQRTQTNAFLASIDGIAGKKGETLPNVITIVLTNHIDSIDDAAKRPGRLGTHIEVGIPDAPGRRDIFEIYTKAAIEEGILEEVALDWLVQRTTGKTGAFIEGMVTKMVNMPIGRLADNKVPGAEAFDSPHMKLTREDLERAYHEMSNTKIGKQNCGDILIPKEVRFTGLKSQFKKLGIAGVPSKLLGVVQDIMLTRFFFKKEMAQVNYNAPRSIFLYGPSGTGKSSFVKSLPQIFGLDSDRFKIYSASDLWQGWEKNLKQELKELIEPAIRMGRDLKDEAPLSVVVIEDIDRLFKLARRSKVTESSIMNDFLAEIDIAFNEKVGEILQGKGHVKIGNLLIVATMTTSNELHPDIIGYGQQCIHVEMGLPSTRGRKEIFHHYLEPYYNQKRLGKNVNLDRLANLTEKRSGEFIKGVIVKAATYPLHREQLARMLDQIGFFDKETFDITKVDEEILTEIKHLAQVSENASNKFLVRQLRDVPQPMAIDSLSSSSSMSLSSSSSMVDDESEVLQTINPITQDDLERAIIECNADKLKEWRDGITV